LSSIRARLPLVSGPSIEATGPGKINMRNAHHKGYGIRIIVMAVRPITASAVLELMPP
jgi:hypothetical protein